MKSDLLLSSFEEMLIGTLPILSNTEHYSTAYRNESISRILSFVDDMCFFALSKMDKEVAFAVVDFYAKVTEETWDNVDDYATFLNQEAEVRLLGHLAWLYHTIDSMNGAESELQVRMLKRLSSVLIDSITKNRAPLLKLCAVYSEASGRDHGFLSDLPWSRWESSEHIGQAYEVRFGSFIRDAFAAILLQLLLEGRTSMSSGSVRREVGSYWIVLRTAIPRAQSLLQKADYCRENIDQWRETVARVLVDIESAASDSAHTSLTEALSLELDPNAFISFLNEVWQSAKRSIEELELAPVYLDQRESLPADCIIVSGVRLRHLERRWAFSTDDKLGGYDSLGLFLGNYIGELLARRLFWLFANIAKRIESPPRADVASVHGLLEKEIGFLNLRSMERVAVFCNGWRTFSEAVERMLMERSRGLVESFHRVNFSGVPEGLFIQVVQRTSLFVLPFKPDESATRPDIMLQNGALGMLKIQPNISEAQEALNRDKSWIDLMLGPIQPTEVELSQMYLKFMFYADCAINKRPNDLLFLPAIALQTDRI